MENETKYTSKSAGKLSGKRSLGAPINLDFAYCILDFVSIFTAILENVAVSEVNFLQN